VIRFRNQALDDNIQLVVDEIRGGIGGESASQSAPLPNPPHQGEGAEQGLIGAGQNSLLRPLTHLVYIW
jgi:hypothetical protein